MNQPLFACQTNSCSANRGLPINHQPQYQRAGRMMQAGGDVASLQTEKLEMQRGNGKSIPRRGSRAKHPPG